MIMLNRISSILSHLAVYKNQAIDNIIRNEMK